MEQEASLALDVEPGGDPAASPTAVRIAVVGISGRTRDGSAATITSNCQTPSAFEREIERLRGELDAALVKAREVLGDVAAPPRPRRASRGPRKGAASGAEKPQLAIDLTVAAVMTRDVRSVGRNARLSEAKALLDAGRFRHLVVLDEEQAIAGVLSHRDIAFEPLAWSLGQGRAGYERVLEMSRVKDVMQADVVTIEPGAPLQAAAALMLEHKIGCLPVVESERLVGLVTEGDCVALLARATGP